MKSIASIDINVSDIPWKKPYLSCEDLKTDLMPWIILQSTIKSPQFTDILSSIYSNGNIQIQIRKWWVPLISAIYLLYFSVRPLSIPLNNQHQVYKRGYNQRDSSLLQNNNASCINSTTIKLCQTKMFLKSVSCAIQW